MTDTTQELKPCPFCGAEAEVEEGLQGNLIVGCTKGLLCNLFPAPASQSRDRDKAVMDWNTRPIEEAQTARIKELEAEVERLQAALSSIKEALSLELNMCNYNEDEVAELNDQSIEAYQIADTALKEATK